MKLEVTHSGINVKVEFGGSTRNELLDIFKTIMDEIDRRQNKLVVNRSLVKEEETS